MIRTLLVSCVALLVWEPLAVTPAAACISCEYTPEVANSPHPKARRKVRNSMAKERPAKRRAPARQVASPKDVPQAAPRRDVVTKEAAPERETSAESETSAAEAYPTSKKPSAAPVERAGAEAAASQEHMQASTGAPAPSSISAPSKPPETVAAPLGCKKFIPTAGVTVSVACN